MSIDKLIAENQPESFAFSKENEAEIKKVLAKYPERAESQCCHAFVRTRTASA